jgi:hypothetical protein
MCVWVRARALLLLTRVQPPWQCHICGCDNESSWEQVRDVRCLLSRNNSRCAVHAVRVHERHDR